MDWIKHPDRRQNADRRQAHRPPGSAERRAPDLIERPPGRNPVQANELPPDPTPGDPGADARNERAIERGRASERERTSERSGDRPNK